MGIAQDGRDLGVNPNLLARWRKEFQAIRAMQWASRGTYGILYWTPMVDIIFSELGKPANAGYLKNHLKS
jgi:hypothetical protein